MATRNGRLTRYQIATQLIGCGVYFARDSETGCVKVGYSDDCDRRVRSLGMEMLHWLPCHSLEEARMAERCLHYALRDRHVEGEIYDLPVEFFHDPPEDSMDALWLAERGLKEEHRIINRIFQRFPVSRARRYTFSWINRRAIRRSG